MSNSDNVIADTTSDDTIRLTSVRNRGEHVYTGLASKESDRDAEIDSAVKHAVEQRLQTDVIIVDFFQYQKETSLSTLSHGRLNFYWSEKKTDYYSENLEIIDSETYDWGSQVEVRFPGDNASRLSIPDPGTWFDSIPVFPGYTTFLGISDAKSLLTRSFEYSDEDALSQAVSYLSASIDSDVDVYNSSTFSFTYSKTTQEAVFTIRGFRIIDRWSDGQNFYSLAVLPES